MGGLAGSSADCRLTNFHFAKGNLRLLHAGLHWKNLLLNNIEHMTPQNSVMSC